MSLVLRPYQEDIIEKVRALMRQGVRRILVVSPTGSGKTVLTGSMLAASARKGMPSIFSVHRRELVTQSTRTFSKVGIPHGIVAANFQEDLRHMIQVASIGTLKNRLGRVKKPKLMIWDECHHIVAAGWNSIFSAYADAFHIGLTATPVRLDGSGLKDHFDVIVEGPKVRWLIDNGYLCDYKLYAPPGASMEGVHKRMGDFVKGEVLARVDKPTITGDAINHYERLAFGKRAVVFCVSVEHSKHVVDQYNSRGIVAVHVDGETPSYERDRATDLFAQGKIQVMSNVDLFGEGYDLPVLEVCQMLRPTQSLGLYLQQVGRALRTAPGKTHAILLDHVGNCERHGLPDEEREWSLAGIEKKRRAKDPDDISVKVCPMCFAAQEAGRGSCAYCGYVYQSQGRDVKEVAGQLSEVDQAAIARRREEQRKISEMKRRKGFEQHNAKTLPELIAIGRSRGYKYPERWARHVFISRRNQKI